MADLEITAEELCKIDTNQIAEMTLKDGTVFMVNGGEEVQDQPEEEFVQEEQAQEVPVEEGTEGQENQLRHRPMMPMRPMHVPMRPIMTPPRPMVVPMRPIHPKPMVIPRGPVMRPVPVFRARPGMPVRRPAVIPPKVITVPVHTPHGVYPSPIHKQGMLYPKPGMVRPMPVLTRPMFRARPNVEQEEEAAEYEQEEIPGEEQYNVEDQQEDYQADDLRHRPMMMVPPPRHIPMRPRVIPPPMPHRRGPMMVPMMGYNTFQPRVFRGRPRPRVVPVPMFTPLNTTFQPRMYGFGMRGPKYGPYPAMRTYAFRGKERSNSYDAKEEEQQQEYQEGQEQQCTKSVCTKCGKEF